IYDFNTNSVENNYDLYSHDTIIDIPLKIINIENINNQNISEVEFHQNIPNNFYINFADKLYIQNQETPFAIFLNKTDDNKIAVKINNKDFDKIINQFIQTKINIQSIINKQKGPSIHIPVLQINKNIWCFEPIVNKKKYINQNLFSLTLFDNINIANIITIISIGLIGIIIGNNIISKIPKNNNELSNILISKKKNLSHNNKKNFIINHNKTIKKKLISQSFKPNNINKNNKDNILQNKLKEADLCIQNLKNLS
ncbi:unnamed protein product, partial [marine sediment metagenome]